MKTIVLLLFLGVSGGMIIGCSKSSSSSPPPPPANNNQPAPVSSMTDAELIDDTPAFKGEGMTVVTRRLSAPGGSTVVGAGAVAFSDPRQDPSDANVMLVDFVADYGYDNNAANLTEAWAKQNAPVISNFEPVQLTACGDNGYRGTLRVPVAVGMHFTLLKIDPAVMSSAAAVDPSWFFTGLPYDSTYDDPPQELSVWVAPDNQGIWHTFVKRHPGAPSPTPPLPNLPNPNPNPNPTPGLQIDGISANPSPVTEEQSFTLSATVSGVTGTPTYQWAQFAGPTAPIADNFALSTTATAPVTPSIQVLEFSFTVSDQSGSVTRTMSLTVNPVPALQLDSATVSPSSLVGGQSATLACVTSGGKGLVRYAWSQVSGPTAAIIDSQAATTGVTTPAVSSNQDIAFRVTVSDDRTSIISQPVTVSLTPAPVQNTAPVHVSTTVSGIDSSTTAVAALTKATVEVAFRDDDGDALSCQLQRLAGETAAIAFVSSSSAGNITTFTFDVTVVSDPVPSPGTFTFDAVAADPGGLQAVSPQRQVRVFRRNRFVGLPGYREACSQVDTGGTVNEGPGMLALGSQAQASANETDLDVYVDFPAHWAGADNSVPNGGLRTCSAIR